VRQTVIVMLKGAVLAEHESPGAATVHVRGRVRLSAGTCPGRCGPVTCLSCRTCATGSKRWRPRRCC
jgi:hypothetical protein